MQNISIYCSPKHKSLANVVSYLLFATLMIYFSLILVPPPFNAFMSKFKDVYNIFWYRNISIPSRSRLSHKILEKPENLDKPISRIMKMQDDWSFNQF